MAEHYTREHEWVRVEGDVATCGISPFAAEKLGDVVHVELPAIGTQFAQGDEMGGVESAKAFSEVYAPVSGEIIAVNEALTGAPETVNASPQGDGWFVRIKLKDKGEVDKLMDAAAYAEFTK